MKQFTVLFLSGFVLLFTTAYGQSRWQIRDDNSIVWDISGDKPHYDHLEMSGLQVSAVLRYGVKPDGSFYLERSMVWPMLRTLPNNTHASLMQRFAIDYPALLLINGLSLSDENVKSIKLDGRLLVISEYATGDLNTGAARKTPPSRVVELTRVFFPSPDKPMLCEHYTLKNISSETISITVPSLHNVYKTDPAKGKDGSYRLVTSIRPGDDKLYFLEPGQTCAFRTTVQAYKDGQEEIIADVDSEEAARMVYVDEIKANLQFISPDKVLSTAFDFAKIRASESIYKTAGGLMHSPGGESYYAAIWANDQAEYVNPFFPYLGYKQGNESALNAFMHFARFINEEYNPLPSSIIAEGTDIWNGASDRGDAAMIAYGASRYALARADKEEAVKLWPLIRWCLEYCKRNVNEQGVVKSDTDELENRFPAGDANLCTSVLYYDALVSAGYLAGELGKTDYIKQYSREAKTLRQAINKHFGAVVEGFDTYRYYEGNDILRSWICMPLTASIFERKQGTLEALFSARLWTSDGLLTQAGTDTFWDRSTLYALRGAYAAGERQKATEHFRSYSLRRLLGDHVPYPIEAWPEGNQRHLAAESALYCRIVTEGIFGIRPTGFGSFDIAPQLPKGWDNMELKNIMAYNAGAFDIQVNRTGKDKINVIIRQNGKTVKSMRCKNGQTCGVKLK